MTAIPTAWEQAIDAVLPACEPGIADALWCFAHQSRIRSTRRRCDAAVDLLDLMERAVAATEPIIRANERERSYGDAYREGWTESRADEAQRLAGQAASAELTRFEDGSLTISEIGPATEPGWVPVTPLLINALIDHAASARRAVAEEISQAIEAEARDEWTLGRDWVAVAAAIARRVGGASCSE